MSATYTRHGILESDSLVRLDEPVHLPRGRVRVRIETIPANHGVQNGKTLFAWLHSVHDELKRSGYRFPSKEEVNLQIREERESWGE